MRRLFWFPIPAISLVILGGAVLYAQAPGATSPGATGKDPQYQTTGDQERSYSFPETGESVPYHIYVPTKWNKNVKLPMIVVLHGANADEAMPLIRGDRILEKAAEEHGYILASPLGYRIHAAYNNPFKIVPVVWPESKGPRPGPPPELGPRAPIPTTPATPVERERSEKDVINVMDLVAKEYNVDLSRVYLTGNSMGGAGTWYIGEKYADRFVAIAPSAGPVSPEDYPYDRLKHVAVLVIHGDQDQVTSIDASRTMVQHAREHGVDVSFFEVKGGEHYMGWSHAVPQLFDFFDQHNKKK